MEQTKVKMKQGTTAYRKGAQRLCQFLLSGVGGLILGGGTYMGQALPLGASLIAAQSPGERAFGATVGAIVGYFLRCEPAEAVEYTAVSLLMLLTLFLFQGTALHGYKWFMPLCCMMVCGVMDGVRSLSAADVAIFPWVCKGLTGALATYIFRRAMIGQRWAWVLLVGTMVFSLGGSGKYVDLGLLLGILIASVTGEMIPGTVMGMALDLCVGYDFPMTFVIAFPAICYNLFPYKKRWVKGILYGLLPIGVLIAFGDRELSQLISVAVGAVVGTLCSYSPSLTPEVTAVENRGREQAQEQAVAVLEALGMELPDDPEWSAKERDRIFDGVGDRLCRNCTGFRQCWGVMGLETYESLVSASAKILERGVAHESDFPQSFRDRCCCLPEFIRGINGELEAMLYRRRYDSLLRENRRLLEQEYRLLARLIRKGGKSHRTVGERRYTPLVSICSARKEGISGDRGVCFLAPNGSYYVILCDGMGTGEEAAGLSGYAVRLMEKFLRSGLSPTEALSLFNGNMTLRGCGTFSTIDLLRLDLQSGMAYLYKWGGAPSFWREGEKTRKIGNPSPPPGVGIGGKDLPEKFKLSMGYGQYLVLISDGVYCEDTEDVIGSSGALSPRELAATLVSNVIGDDDMTAIVVTLERRYN